MYIKSQRVFLNINKDTPAESRPILRDRLHTVKELSAYI